AKIEIDGVLYKDGYIKYDKAIYRFGKLSHHLLTFTGSISTLNDILGDDTLQDLNFSEFSHEIDAEKVRQGMAFDQALYNNKVIYPLMSNTTVLLADILTTGEINLPGSDNNRLLEPKDFRPAIQVQEILAKINTKYDLSIRLDQGLNLDDLYMWCSVEPEDSSSWITYNNDAVGDYPAAMKESNGVTFLIGMSNIAQTTFTYIIEPADPNTQWTITLFKAPYADSSWLPAGDDFTYTGVGTETVVFVVPTTYTEYGVEPFFKATLSSNNPLDTFTVDYNVTSISNYGQETDYFDVRSTGLIVAAGLDFSRRLPSMKVITFLTGLMGVYNLIPTKSPLQRVDYDLLTYDNWMGKGAPEDITEGIDIKSHTITLPNVPKSITYKYQEPKAWKNKTLYFEKTGVGYGDSILKPINAQKGGETIVVEVPFENMAWTNEFKDGNEYLVGFASDFEVTSAGGILEEGFTGVFDSSFLMIWDRSEQPVSDINVNGFVDVGGAVLSYKLCNSFDGPVPANEQVTNTLNFSNELDFYRNGKVPYKIGHPIRPGSFAINYFPYIKQLTAPTARLHTYEAVISLAKLSQIKANTYLKIKDNWFFINSMSVDTLTRI
ncbi:MAG: hypothetical protein KAU20_07210, partial [Nanoarchaeota archaeon]|nr:hypothetical protein [Nanoarchaeota archaeon]